LGTEFSPWCFNLTAFGIMFMSSWSKLLLCYISSS